MLALEAQAEPDYRMGASSDLALQSRELSGGIPLDPLGVGGAPDVGLLSDAVLDEEEEAGLADLNDALEPAGATEDDVRPEGALHGGARWPQVLAACGPGRISHEQRQVLLAMAGTALACADLAADRACRLAAPWRHTWHRNAVHLGTPEHPGQVEAASLLRLAPGRPSEALVIRPTAGASAALQSADPARVVAAGSTAPEGDGEGKEEENPSIGAEDSHRALVDAEARRARVSTVLVCKTALRAASCAAVRACAAAAPDTAIAALETASRAVGAAWLSPTDFASQPSTSGGGHGGSGADPPMDWRPVWHLGVVAARLLAESNRAVAASHGGAELGGAPRAEAGAMAREGAGRVFGDATAAVNGDPTVGGHGTGSSSSGDLSGLLGGVGVGDVDDGGELDDGGLGDGVQEDDALEDDLLGPGWEDGGEEASSRLAGVTSAEAVERAVSDSREEGKEAGARAWEDGGTPGDGSVGVPPFGLFPGSGAGGGPAVRLSAQQARACGEMAQFSAAALSAAGAHRHAATLATFLLSSSPSAAVGSGAWGPMPGGGPWSGAGARSPRDGSFGAGLKQASSAVATAGGADKDAARNSSLGPSRARDAASLHRAAEEEAKLAQGALAQRGASAAARSAVEALAVALVHGRGSAEVLAQRAERRLAARFRALQEAVHEYNQRPSVIERRRRARASMRAGGRPAGMEAKEEVEWRFRRRWLARRVVRARVLARSARWRASVLEAGLRASSGEGGPVPARAAAARGLGLAWSLWNGGAARDVTRRAGTGALGSKGADLWGRAAWERGSAALKEE